MKKLLPSNQTSAFRLQLSDKHGFTLVELLVVVAIIAVLSVIGITVFTGVQKNARDARRREDVTAISKAYEANYSNNSPHYRQLVDSDFAGGKVPVDPQTAAAYTGMVVAAGADTYTVCASLENANGNSSSNTGTPASGSTATYYCAKNSQ